MLKQALIILEDQLKEFETTVIDKNKQINQLTRDRYVYIRVLEMYKYL